MPQNPHLFGSGATYLSTATVMGIRSSDRDRSFRETTVGNGPVNRWPLCFLDAFHIFHGQFEDHVLAGEWVVAVKMGHVFVQVDDYQGFSPSLLVLSRNHGAEGNVRWKLGPGNLDDAGLIPHSESFCGRNRLGHERIIEYALQNGHSVVWDGDVSEEEFDSKKMGYAVVPETDWEYRLHEEQDLEKVFTGPVKEKVITQELRQKTLDNFTTTDDHLMHIVGLARDQDGTRFFLTKNSSGTDRKNDGYMYMSQAFVRLKTTAILVNKAAIPEDIASKL